LVLFIKLQNFPGAINKGMSSLISKKSANLILDWCINKYGPSIHNDLSTLEIRFRSKLEFFGEYCADDNTIYLNPIKHKSLIEWVNTVIHEYTHFRQNIDGMYTKYYSKYGRTYENHPHEVNAHRIADRDQMEARRWVLQNLRKNKK
jgi:hypothetical protein